MRGAVRMYAEVLGILAFTFTLMGGGAALIYAAGLTLAGRPVF